MGAMGIWRIGDVTDGRVREICRWGDDGGGG